MQVSPRIIFLILVGVNLLALTFTGYNWNHSNLQAHTRMMTVVDNEPEIPHDRFINPEIAYEILSLLDVFSVYEDPNRSEADNEVKYGKPYLGLRTDDNYCDKHRAHFVYYPETAYKSKNIMSNFKAMAIFRLQMIRKMGGVDVMPHIHSGMPDELQNQGLYDLREDVNMFFTATSMYTHRQIGKHFSCLTQASNHIPGHNSLYRKDQAGRSVVEYSKKYVDRPQCFNEHKFFPKTWILNEVDQCKAFFEIFNSKQYQKLKKERGLVYIRKIGANAHQGSGVFPVNTEEEQSIREKYANGALCGQVKKNNLIQYAVWNPLLINGRKFDFRMFMLVASSNPLITYYHDGFLRISLRDYDPDSKEPGAILTNIALSKPFFDEATKNGTYNGFTKDELMGQVFWMMPQLADYLLKTGKVTDPNWLDNYLRPEFKKAMVHLMRMAQHTFAPQSSLFEIYGLDFMLDDNLNLWFIEANIQPLLDGWSPESSKFFNQIIYDSFDIAHALLKSRVKRIVKYVNKLIKETQDWGISWDSMHIDDLKTRRKEFQIISRNYFEPEFMPAPTNEFQMIIDDNLHGEDRYFGLLEEECF